MQSTHVGRLRWRYRQLVRVSIHKHRRVIGFSPIRHNNLARDEFSLRKQAWLHQDLPTLYRITRHKSDAMVPATSAKATSGPSQGSKVWNRVRQRGPRYGFNGSYFVARPLPSMSYLRK